MKLSQLAFSTNAFKKTSVWEAVRHIAQIGYGGVEIMADAPHMRPDRFTNAQVQELRNLIDGLGLKVSNVNAFTGFCFDGGDTYHPTWVEPGKAARRQRIEHTRRAIEMTAMLGCNHISLQPAGPYQGRNVDELYEIFAEGLAECVPMAKACGVSLGVEPEPGLLIERSDQYDRLKQGWFKNEPAITMNCDLGHLYCVREDPASIVRSHISQIRHLHLEDIDKDRIHQHLIPGQGVMDFPGIFKAIDESGYQGMVTVELYPYTSTAEQVARRAFEHLKGFLTEG